MLFYGNIIILDVVSDSENVAWFHTNGVAELFTLVDVLQMLSLVLFVYQEQIVFEISEGVWLEVSEVSYVIVKLKLVAK